MSTSKFEPYAHRAMQLKHHKEPVLPSLEQSFRVAIEYDLTLNSYAFDGELN